MSNIFNLKRFGRYALLNYWFHKRQYLSAIAGVMVMLMIFLCNFKFAFTAVTWESNRLPIDRIIDDFTSGFYIAGLLFTVWIIGVSMRGINGISLTMHDMLIPVSTFERYLFAILNSTMVATLVYIVVFQLVSTCMESMYLFSDNGYVFKGFIGYNEEAVVNGGFVNECHLSLKEIVSNGFPSYTDVPRNIVINSIMILYTLTISIFMWGEITFQNRGAVVLNILVHLAIGAAIVALFVLSPNETTYRTGALHVSYVVDDFIKNNAIYALCLLYSLPIAYQWVVWKKLKNISVTK